MKLDFKTDFIGIYVNTKSIIRLNHTLNFLIMKKFLTQGKEVFNFIKFEFTVLARIASTVCFSLCVSYWSTQIELKTGKRVIITLGRSCLPVACMRLDLQWYEGNWVLVGTVFTYTTKLIIA